jgi:thiol-disulfide isomerase/thioredoxin
LGLQEPAKEIDAMGTRKVALVVALAVAVIAGMWGYAHWRAGATAAVSVVKGTAIDGTPVDLAAYRGQPTVVNFFGTWCPWCVREAADLAAFSKEYADVHFVGIAYNDTALAVRSFAAKYGLAYPMVLDEGSIVGEFKIQGYPTTVFFDAQGVEKARIVGASDRATFEANLQKAL